MIFNPWRSRFHKRILQRNMCKKSWIFKITTWNRNNFSKKKYKKSKFLMTFWQMSRFLKVGHEIALQPKLSENASSQIGSGSQKLLEIWPWFFYQLIDLVGGGVESAHGFFIRRLDFSVDHFEVDTFRKFWLFKIPLHFL